MHQYAFEAPQLLTRGDTIQPETVAFRDVDYRQLIASPEGNAEQEMTITVNLDREPV